MRVAVGMSGGVDSTLVAWLLREAGHEVIGLTMLIWDDRIPLHTAARSGCYGPGEKEDAAAAAQAAAQLGIPHHTIALAAEYKAWVLNAFRRQYLEGLTPNPCAVCNPVMKFGFLLEKARAQGIAFDRFATGHYARLRQDPVTGRQHLHRGVDAAKDQTYFLARLTQAQLATTQFPLGERTKREIKDLAARVGFGALAGKAESQDFFEGEDRSVLFESGDVRPGPIVDGSGRQLGEHRGIIHYTIGQREGLGLATGTKLYVKEIRPESNTLLVAPREEVMCDACLVTDVSWIAGSPPHDEELDVRLRYRHPGVRSRVRHEAPDAVTATFAAPQFAVTPGQLAVFYRGDEVLGGGWIAR